MNNIFKGLITAMITPFKDDHIDFTSFEKLLERQIANNVDGVVIAGTTGEGSSLTLDEYNSLMQAAVKIAKKRIPIIAGCCSINTKSALNMALECQKIGIDGLMCTVPPYIKPMQEGLWLHFKTIHDATNLPIMIYATLGRTGTDIADDTILKFRDLPRLIALKDSGSDIERPLRISSRMHENFNLLTADDSVALAYNAQGGRGCVSVAANIVPKLCKQLQQEWQNGNVKVALKIHQQLLPLYKALFAETNPIPVKYAAHYLGLCSSEIRLPLTEASNETKARIEVIVKTLLGD